LDIFTNGYWNLTLAPDVWCLGLTWVNSRRSDMFENGYCNPVTQPDMSGKGLNRCEDRDDRTYLVQESNMSDFAYWNLAMDLDKSRELK
jgi:hypothetical protein